MVYLQCKVTGGKKYWYLLESRRVNGKSRPFVIAYLGKPQDILKRLASQKPYRFKSYQHGLVHAFCAQAHKLSIVQIINEHVKSNREYMALRPICNGLTAGESVFLAALARACRPTSKMGWATWAETTSLAYLLNADLKKLDSQHFWDHMDCLSESAIEKIEEEIINAVWKGLKIDAGTLSYDTTNFFTYINSMNSHCTIAKRGKNKQRRNDLRQIGYGLVVTQKEHIPLCQYTYDGNLTDTSVFKTVLVKIKRRLLELGLDPNKHTIVFDKGIPSETNFALIDDLGSPYVTSMKTSAHKSLLENFEQTATEISVDGETLRAVREIREIYDKKRVVIGYFSQSLKEGIVNGVLSAIEKCVNNMESLRVSFSKPRKNINKSTSTERIERKIKKSLKKTIGWELVEKRHYEISVPSKKFQGAKEDDFNTQAFAILNLFDFQKLKPHHCHASVSRKKIKKSTIRKMQFKKFVGRAISWKPLSLLRLHYWVNLEKYNDMKRKAGFKIIVSSRVEWESAEIISTYNGQAAVEEEFKCAKNPFHLTFRPQYHWTDQKIRVHYLICFISHLLSRLIYKETSEKIALPRMRLDTFLEKLISIRVYSQIIEKQTDKANPSYEMQYGLEETSPETQELINALFITPHSHVTDGVINVGIYTKNTKK